MTADQHIVAFDSKDNSAGCVWVSAIGAMGPYPFERHCAGESDSDYVAWNGGFCIAGRGNQTEVLAFGYADGWPVVAATGIEGHRVYSALGNRRNTVLSARTAERIFIFGTPISCSANTGV